MRVTLSVTAAFSALLPCPVVRFGLCHIWISNTGAARKDGPRPSVCRHGPKARYAVLMKSLDKPSVEPKEGFWRSCKDSITHSIEHFSAASQENDPDPFHHRKWAILSVAHAAEVYCNLLLCVFDPNHPKGSYPSLNEARKLLKGHPRLIGSEQHVNGDVLSALADQRNRLMHMPAPEMLSATDTAIALLSLLHIIRRRTGLDTTESFRQSPPIERDIFDEIGWREHEAWFRIAERLVKWEYGDGHIEVCNNCGALAVPPGLPCQACFEPVSHFRE
jgi:hypothetical protein